MVKPYHIQIKNDCTQRVFINELVPFGTVVLSTQF